MKVEIFPLGPLETNSFLAIEGSSAVAVDVGGDPSPMLRFLKREGLTLTHVLLTHLHFDHTFGVKALHDATGAVVLTCAGDAPLMQTELGRGGFMGFPKVPEFSYAPVEEGEIELLGQPCMVLFTPGHTLASIAYVVGDAAFIHDTIFMPDGGTARADFPGGSAKVLWNSIQRIMALPDDTRLFTGHDYCPGGRKPEWESTVAEQRARNTHLVKARTEEEFVALREKRDRELPMPKLILHSLQVNIQGGRLPEPEENGIRYLKIPLDALDAPWDE